MPLVSTKPTAIGCYIFAGGFTLGVSKHFNVRLHLEDGKFGVETAKLNFPNLKIITEPSEWPDRFNTKIDLIYCNPPCAPWSTAGIVKGQSTEAQTDWKAHPQAQCVVRAFDYFLKIKPTIWCFESVQQVYSRGSVMLEEMAAKATALGYRITHCFIEAKNHGVPQHRKRYFMVIHKVLINWVPPNSPQKTVNEVLSSLTATDGATGTMPKTIKAMIPYVPPGGNYKLVWKKLDNPPCKQPAFIYDKLNGESTASFTLLGSCTKVHPTEDRMLSADECKVLCGYPSTFKMVGKVNDRYAQAGKGVCPPVADWLSGNLVNAIKLNRPVKPGQSCVMVHRSSIERTEHVGCQPSPKTNLYAAGKTPRQSR